MSKFALVTGSGGFIGRHMVKELEDRGYYVDRCEIVEGCDALDLFRSVIHPRQYDLVVHCAASSPHRLAIDTQPLHFPYNVALDALMFEWAIRTQQKRVIYFSSSAAYNVNLQMEDFRYALREDDVSFTNIGCPDAVYGWAKLTGERMAMAAREAGVKVTVVRPFSGYGEDQSDNFPFRAILNRVFRKDNPVQVWGDTYQTRDWIHVSDVVRGALAIAESDTEKPVNLCTGIGTSMRDFVGIAAKFMGYEPDITAVRDKPTGVEYRVGDPERMHKYYTHLISIDEGIFLALKS